MSRDQLHAEGVIIEALSDGAYRVELPNGHRCVARTDKNATSAPPVPGDKVSLAFHPYDLSRGRIILPD